MNDHIDLQTELPDYAAGRPDPETRPRVEAHLRTCQECRAMLSDFQELGRVMRRGGTPLLTPHPPVAEVRRLALSRGAAADPVVQHHLDLCASCSLEMEGWRRMGRPVVAFFRPSWWMLASASAAALVAGIGLGMLVMRAPVSTPRPSPAAVAIGPQIFLPPILRGEPGRVEYELTPGQQAVVVAWPAAVPEQAAQDALFRFEIGRPGAGADWSYDMPAAGIRRHLDSAELVTLLVPATALGPGRHEARVIASGAGGGDPLYLAIVDVRAPGAPQ